MAGIYIHIPFCKQACNYCNFYFSTSMHFKESFLKSLLQEIEINQDYLEGESVSSIYFGGGTPSILELREIEQILNVVQKTYALDSALEITLEANPDDLSLDKTKDLYSIGINRLSIGTQSFFDEDLKFMQRAHNSKEAYDCIDFASKVGFKDLSIDLIYGVPTQNEANWEQNLETLNKLGINHLSSYALTVEENTPLYHEIKKGKVQSVDENLAAEHFAILQKWAKNKNWNHYEISNLAKDENYSKHNTSYWQGKKYVGFGPAAHSYNGKSRQWNISNLKKYIDGIQSGDFNFELEHLSRVNMFNEKIMTGLRTIWGLDKEVLNKSFPEFYSNFEKQLEAIRPDWLNISKEKITLSKEGMFYADGIAAALFSE